ncbi:hypothetical protein GCM10025776_24700 [Corallincola platygyrae]
MQEITNSIQRVRELSIQAANGVYSREDRQSLQEEASQLLKEVDRINETTRFGDTKLFDNGSGYLFDVSERNILQGLRKSYLQESTIILGDQLGLFGGGELLTVDLEHVDGQNGTLAFVEYQNVPGDPAKELRLVVDMDDFGNGFDNGLTGDNLIRLDETILHEMTHGVMAVNMDLSTKSTWFVEGSAEVVRGADTRLANDIENIPGGLSAIRDELLNNWQGNTGQPSTDLEVAAVYSGGYVVMRYIHERTNGTGIETMMQSLKEGATLDEAIAETGRWASEAGLFTELGAGNTFNDVVNDEMNIYNEDNGALGGFDADGGDVRQNTMRGLGTGSSSGSEGFLERFIENDDDFDGTDYDVTNFHDPQFSYVRLESYQTEINGAGGRTVSFQAGADAFQLIEATLGTFSTENLGLDEVDLVDNAQFAIIAADDALRVVDKQRSLFGAVINRFESTLNSMAISRENLSDSRSRQRDTDFAFETAELVKKQIQVQASTSMLGQANQQWQSVLSLLG